MKQICLITGVILLSGCGTSGGTGACDNGDIANEISAIATEELWLHNAVRDNSKSFPYTSDSKWMELELAEKTASKKLQDLDAKLAASVGKCSSTPRSGAIPAKLEQIMPGPEAVCIQEDVGLCSGDDFSVVGLAPHCEMLTQTILPLRSQQAQATEAVEAAAQTKSQFVLDFFERAYKKVAYDLKEIVVESFDKETGSSKCSASVQATIDGYDPQSGKLNYDVKATTDGGRKLEITKDENYNSLAENIQTDFM